MSHNLRLRLALHWGTSILVTGRKYRTARSARVGNCVRICLPFVARRCCILLAVVSHHSSEVERHFIFRADMSPR